MRDYRPNPKHKEPWQPGRKGTLCSHGLDDDAYERLQQAVPGLLETAVEVGNSLFQFFEGRAYKAVTDGEGEFYHGFPVGWVEVPTPLRLRWVREGIAKRADVNKHWTLEDR